MAGEGDDPNFLRALRRDPSHAAELAVLYALPQLAPHVACAHERARTRHPSDSVEQLARRLERRAVAHSRRDGALCGSSLYVALPAAIASLYCRQLRLVLQIAELYGRDPADPARAAEALVIQQRHADVAAAARALSEAHRRVRASAFRHPGGVLSAARDGLRLLPGILGLRLTGWRHARPLDKLISAVELASYVVPFVGIPFNSIGSARATRQLGNSAIAFYAANEGVPGVAARYTLPPALTRVQRLRLIAISALTCLLAGVVVELVVGSFYGLLGGWVFVAPSELFLVTTFARLLWITRAPR
jgi:hypothetical protein